MRTPKQIAASRENGRQSHGAITPEGKARVVNANLESGIYAETRVLVSEDQDELQELNVRMAPSPLRLCRGFPVGSALPNQLHGPMPSGKATRRSPGGSTGSNSTRRVFHTALNEIERLEARDHDIIVSPGPFSPATDSPETQLPILGSLRTNDSGDPAAVFKTPPRQPRNRTNPLLISTGLLA